MNCPKCGGAMFGRALRKSDGTFVARMPDIVCGSCGFEVEPACEPKEGKVEKKVWEWQGMEASEESWTLCHYLSFGSDTKVDRPAHVLRAATLDELRKLAVVSGCVEVVRPVACPVCFGKAATHTDSKGVAQVYCGECNVSGPSKPTRTEAVQSWADMAERMGDPRMTGHWMDTVSKLGDLCNRHHIGKGGENLVDIVVAYVDKAEAEKKAGGWRKGKPNHYKPVLVVNRAGQYRVAVLCTDGCMSSLGCSHDISVEAWHELPEWKAPV